MKILIVEDNDSLREILVKSLQAEKYVTEEAADCAHAWEKMAVYDYDCILLDVMLPDGSGLALLQRLKELKPSAAVIIISARDAIEDRVNGLEVGADDYLPKPFDLAELQARIRSLQRRRMGQGGETLTIGNLSISLQSRIVTVEGEKMEMSRKEYEILLYFAQRPGHMITKEALAEAVWGDYIDQCDNYDFIYAQLKNLRKKLNEAGATAEIKTIYGFGYKMVEP